MRGIHIMISVEDGLALQVLTIDPLYSAYLGIPRLPRLPRVATCNPQPSGIRRLRQEAAFANH